MALKIIKNGKKSLVINTLEDAIRYFKSDDPGTNAARVIEHDANGVPAYINRETGEFIRRGEKYLV